MAKLIEAAGNPRNHRYSVSRGLPNLRRAVADRYRRRFGVDLDPETEVIARSGPRRGCRTFSGCWCSRATSRLCPSRRTRSISMPPGWRGPGEPGVPVSSDEASYFEALEGYAGRGRCRGC